MTGVLLVAAGILAALIVLLVVGRDSHAPEERWEQAPGWPNPRPRIDGELNGVRVAACFEVFVDGGDRANEESLNAIAGGAVPPTLGLMPRGLDSLWERLQGFRPTLVGHRAFDKAWHAEGDELSLLPVLTEPTRRFLTTRLHPLGDRVADEVVRIRQPAGLLGVCRVREWLENASEAARLLALSTTTLPERLAHNAPSDPVIGVRERNRDALLRHFPATEHANRLA